MTQDIEDQVRRTLHAVAEQSTFDAQAGEEQLGASIAGATMVPLDQARRRPRRSTRLFAQAAVILLVVGVATVAIMNRNSGDDGQTTVAATPPATGWYVPRGLPAGWNLDAVYSDWRDVPPDEMTCPCRFERWSDPDGSLTVDLLVTEQLGVDTQAGEDLEFIQLPSGPAQVLSRTETSSLVLLADKKSMVRVSGAGRDEASEIVSQLADESFAPEARGLTPSPIAEIPAGIRSWIAISVSYRTPNGLVGYTLAVPGFGDVRSLDGAGVVAHESGPLRWVSDGTEDPGWLAGTWPGADIMIGDSGPGGTVRAPVTSADLEQLAAALAPATAAEWETFVRSAPNQEPGDYEDYIARIVAPTLSDMTNP